MVSLQSSLGSEPWGKSDWHLSSVHLPHSLPQFLLFEMPTRDCLGVGCGWSQATLLLANMLIGARENRVQSAVLLYTILDCAWHSYSQDLDILLKTSQYASGGKGAVKIEQVSMGWEMTRAIRKLPSGLVPTWICRWLTTSVALEDKRSLDDTLWSHLYRNTCSLLSAMLSEWWQSKSQPSLWVSHQLSQGVGMSLGPEMGIYRNSYP